MHLYNNAIKPKVEQTRGDSSNWSSLIPPNSGNFEPLNNTLEIKFSISKPTQLEVLWLKQKIITQTESSQNQSKSDRKTATRSKSASLPLKKVRRKKLGIDWVGGHVKKLQKSNKRRRQTLLWVPWFPPYHATTHTTAHEFLGVNVQVGSKIVGNLRNCANVAPTKNNKSTSTNRKWTWNI